MSGAWEKKKVGEICTLQRGFDLPKRLREPGAYPLVSSSGIIDTHIKPKVTGPGVVTGRSGSIGNVFYIEEEFWPLNTCLYVKDFHGNDPEFICYFLKQFNLGRFASGAGVPTLNRNTVHDELVLFPSSLSEQKRIVAILDEAFGAIARAKENAARNLANARELFDSYLNRVFTEKGEGWEEKTLSDVTTKIGSGATPKGGKNAYKEEGINLVRSLNVHDRSFKMKNLAFIDDQQAEKLNNVILESEDVLLNITGASVARCCVLPDSILPGRVNQHVSILRTKKDQLNPFFLCYLLTSKEYKDQLLSTGEKGGSTRQAITKAQLQNFVIKFPTSLTVQRKICSELFNQYEQSSRLESIYQKKLAALDELKESILQNAFTGQLTSKSKELELVP
ncbi:EcoKI restriction-modification system protein HsdS [Gimesia maris]|uniref:restriction endonuclease subunit S n=1 Tax=Gimesia maris TaxID=122 RepID=UPI00118D27C8|nr:restriction endonuclease subunit S [Gimesia maris]QDU13600.1 EcoKI restriction-modification system protein HsdS [Gimesia maris]